MQKLWASCIVQAEDESHGPVRGAMIAHARHLANVRVMRDLLWMQAAAERHGDAMIKIPEQHGWTKAYSDCIQRHGVWG